MLTTTQPLALRCWGDECILYDVESGNTHLITPLAAQVLACLGDTPLDVDQLVQRLISDKSNAFQTDTPAASLLKAVNGPERFGLVDSILHDLEAIAIVSGITL